jgi:hypothetical protein
VKSRFSAATLLLISLVLQAPAAGRPPAALADIAFELASDSIFIDHPGPQRARPFCVVATDMDRDGDPDLLINWHLLAPLELFENVDGRYRLLNVPGHDASGLCENPGLPDFYAEYALMLSRIDALDSAGVAVWHDVDRQGNWHVCVKGLPDQDGPVRLVFRANSALERIEGLAEDEYEQATEFDLAIDLPGAWRPREFRFKTELISAQLKLESLPAGERPALPFLVGPDLVSVGAGPLSLWIPDPHGVAWVQVQGSPAPDLFITRGGLQGTLKPPHDPKTDRFYIYAGQPERRFLTAPAGMIPAGYGRGRQVEWVDVDNDGVNELYIGCRNTPNSLLVFDPVRGIYQDRAGDWNLDFTQGDLFVWVDVDRDGWQDLVFLDDGQLRLAQRRADAAFAVSDGAELGLVLPPAEQALDEELFDNREFHLLDLDNDGILDLWISGHGFEGRNVLFRGGIGPYEDVTAEFGLAESRDSWIVLPVDVDNDGFEDAVSIGVLGDRIRLWRNLDGRRFERMAINHDWETSEFLAATVADVDGDGRTDLILVSPQRHVAFNRTRTGNGYLDVTLRPDPDEPLGAVVRAHYSDGRIKAQRYGSAQNVNYSQALQPLHFGVR